MASNDENQPLFTDDEEIRLILLGNTGSGKSTLGNILLQRDDVFPAEELDDSGPAAASDKSTGFVVGDGCVPETKTCAIKENVKAWGKHLKVVDTPSISDPGEKSIQEQLPEAVSLASPGPHAMLFVIRCDARFSSDEKAAFDTVLDTFAEHLKEHLIVVFTRGRQIKQFLERAPKRLKDVMTIVGNNYAVISRTDDPGLREREIQRLLRKVEDVSDHFRTYFIREQFKDMATASACEAPTAGLPLKETRVVVVGKTGAGKSTLGNILLKRKDAIISSDDPDMGFVVSSSFSSQTNKCDYRASENVWGRCMKVVDTPGLFDTSGDFSKTLRELTNVISLSVPGPHAILFVVRCEQRFTPEEYEAFKRIHEMFEDKKNRFLIVVFARDGKSHGQRIEDKIAGAPENLMRVLEMVGNKYAVISKTDDENQKRKEVETLLAMIDSASNDCEDFYKNDDLKEMVELINEEIEKVMKEKDLKWFEAEVLVKKELIKEKEKRFERLNRKLQALLLVTPLIGILLNITVTELWAQYLIKTAAAVESAASALTFPIKVAEVGKFLVEKRDKQKNKCCIS